LLAEDGLNQQVNSASLKLTNQPLYYFSSLSLNVRLANKIVRVREKDMTTNTSPAAQPPQTTNTKKTHYKVQSNSM